MPDELRPPRGVLDTSVVIDLDELDPSQLPLEVPLYTSSGDDFVGLEGLVDIHRV